MKRHCQKCGCELTTERKWCKECRMANKRDYAKKQYNSLKDARMQKKRYGISHCIFCGKEITQNRPNQDTCYDCYKKNHHKTVNSYNSVKRSNKGVTIGRKTILDLGFKIPHLVVHHRDENPDNNNLTNLIVLNRAHHAKIHRLLEKHWSLLSKDNNSNLENCWNSLRDQLTTAYLETNGANVIKITDIGQSAAEPLNREYIYIFDLQEEGSETMYQVPKRL